MPRPTLAQFLNPEWPTGGPERWSCYIRYPGFSSLYVRKGPMYIAGVNDGQQFNALQIANITATKPGKGAFTRLIHSEILRDWPIYVEHVLNERFQSKLERLGFVKVSVDGLGVPCYLLMRSKHVDTTGY